MSNKVIPGDVRKAGARKWKYLPELPVAVCLITGVTVLVPSPSRAADTTADGAASSVAAAAPDPQVAALEKENARLRQQLQAAEAQLGGAAPAAATSSGAAAAIPPAPQTAPTGSTAPASAVPAAQPVASTGTTPTAAVDPAAPGGVDGSGDGLLQEVTVQGTRDSTQLSSVRDQPQSVSVVTASELSQQNEIDMGGITKLADDVKWNSGNSREFSFSIRGLGYQSNTEAEDPSVGVTVDGVSYAYNPLSSFDYVDLASVEVLRGPQGTLGGKDADVGVINLTTNAPSFTPEDSFSLAYGERHSVIASGVAGGTVIDDLLAWRATVSVDDEDGYIQNLYNTSQTYGNRDRTSARLQFLLTPTAGFRAIFRFDLEPTGREFYNGMTIYTPTPTVYGNGAPNPLTTDASTRLARSWFTNDTDYTYAGDYLYGAGQNAVDNNSQQPLITNSLGGSADLQWTLSGGSTLSSISAYKQYYFFASNDEGTPFDITTASGGGVDYHQLTEELRFKSTAGRYLDYQTGIFLLSSVTQGPVSVSKNGWGSDAGAWFANAAQYGTLDADGDGQSLMVNSLDDMRKSGYEYDDKKTAALYAHSDWHLSDRWTLTTGARGSYEFRSTWNNALLTANGYGAALNPVSVNGVELGGFSSNATTGVLTTNDPAQIALANSVAEQYFGVTSYSALTAAQLKQVAAAKALRLAQIGVLWNDVTAQPFSAVQPGFVFSPNYKINDDVTSYVSVQHAEKAGISQTTNGVSNPTPPEKSTAYELGAKSVLLDRTLTFNADVFLNNIQNYQQEVEVFDSYTTALNHDGTNYYTSATGAAARVQSKGLELDAAYDGLPYTSIRFSGDFNDAVYKEFDNAANPVEDANATTPYTNDSGKTLAGASKFSFNVDAEFRHPLFKNADFFTNFNTAYVSRFNSDPVALSSYAWIPGHSITDFSIGLARSDGHFDVRLLIKNLFDNQSHLATTWDSYTPAPPRWIGVQVRGTL